MHGDGGACGWRGSRLVVLAALAAAIVVSKEQQPGAAVEKSGCDKVVSRGGGSVGKHQLAHQVMEGPHCCSLLEARRRGFVRRKEALGVVRGHLELELLHHPGVLLGQRVACGEVYVLMHLAAHKVVLEELGGVEAGAGGGGFERRVERELELEETLA